VASIVTELAPPSPSRAAASPSGSSQACLTDVTKLYDALVDEGAEAAHQGGAKAEAAARWDAFQLRWREAWQEVGARCALGEQSRGPGVERMAWVHVRLPALARKYRESLARFDKEVAPDLAEMGRALAESQRELDLRPHGE
jgi:hypothetical protein